jgi:hypothetical protein
VERIGYDLQGMMPLHDNLPKTSLNATRAPQYMEEEQVGQDGIC